MAKNRTFGGEIQAGLTPLIASLFTVISIITLDIPVMTWIRDALSYALYSGGGQTITIGAMASVFVFSLGYVINDNDWSDFSDIQTGVAFGGVLLIFTTSFIPAVNSFVVANDMLGIGVFIVEAAAFSFVAGFDEHIDLPTVR